MTLEVEFRFEPLPMEQMDCKKFLPKFREKGRVKVLDRSSGQVMELTVCFFSSFPVLCCCL